MLASGDVVQLKSQLAEPLGELAIFATEPRAPSDMGPKSGIHSWENNIPRDARKQATILRNFLGNGQSRSAGFQPAVSQCFQPAGAPIDPAQRSWQRSADWKSAIRQVGNLRYAHWPHFVNSPVETSRLIKFSGNWVERFEHGLADPAGGRVEAKNPGDGGGEVVGVDGRFDFVAGCDAGSVEN